MKVKNVLQKLFIYIFLCLDDHQNTLQLTLNYVLYILSGTSYPKETKGGGT